MYLKQPTLIIVIEKAGSKRHSDRKQKTIKGVAKEIMVPNGTHMDFYDKLDFVDSAVKDVTLFINEKV